MSFWRNACLEEAQVGVKIAGRNINNLRYADDATLMAESKEELKSLLMKSERGERKNWLNTQHSKNKDHRIQSHHFIANMRKQWLTLFFWAPKSLQMVIAAMKLKDAYSLEGNL